MKLRLAILALCCTAEAYAQPAHAPLEATGGTFTLGAETTLVADEGLFPLAEYAAEYLKCPVERQAAADGVLSLLIDPAPEAAAESYRLEITPDHITVRGADYGGVFNGLQALFRLLPPEIYAREGLQGPVTLPCGVREDAPKFAYRGMMLDVARTWIAPEALKRQIDLLAWHNINKLHIHLVDDEGWRIEIKSHPELAEVGGFRGGDSPIRPVYGKLDEKYGGYYTQDEMREIIRYAAVRNIEMIPEIDLPGHSRTIATLHPEIRCRFTPDTTLTAGYDDRSAWCVAREENYALLEDILGEICDLFPSEYVHVGGDEVDMSQWKRCPDCQALMVREGMDDPHRLEDRFMERMSAILRSHGKRTAVWNEAVRTGNLSRDTRVHGWENTRACLDATAKGYPTIVMPGEYFYFDMRQSPEEAGHNWAGIFDARKVYSFDLEGVGFSEEQRRHVAGLQGAFWSELYSAHEPERPDYLDYMLYPRVCALARLAWSGNGDGWERYYEELRTKHYPRMEAMGIRYRLFPPRLVCRDGVCTVTADDGSEIFYVRDDRPGEEFRYTGPVRTDRPHLFRFFTRRGTGRSPYVADRSYYRTITPPRVKITSSMPESSRLPFANAESYRGYSFTQRACHEGDWILYSFEEPVRCREMVLQTGYSHLTKNLFTTGYAEVSYDGAHFEPAGELAAGAAVLKPARAVKAVRVVATCHGNGTPFVVIMPPKIKPVL